MLWKSVKISIAGARLSHLVQKDKIWDHGSMVEHVKTVYMHLQKAYSRKNPEIIKKCMTVAGYQKIKDEIEHSQKPNVFIRSNIAELTIIDVTPGKNGYPDKFKSSVKLIITKQGHENAIRIGNHSQKSYKTEEHWSFIRQGNWWLLDGIQTREPLFHFF